MSKDQQTRSPEQDTANDATAQDTGVEGDEFHNLPPGLKAQVLRLGPNDGEGLKALLAANPQLANSILVAAAPGMGNIAIIRATSTPPARQGPAEQAGPQHKFAPPLSHDEAIEMATDPTDRPLSHDEAIAMTTDPTDKPLPVKKAAKAKAQKTSTDQPTQSPEQQAPAPSHQGLGHGHVTATGLNVRQTPDASSHDNIIGGLYHGAAIEAIGREGAWIRINYKGQPAYVHGAFVEIDPAKAAPKTDAAPTPAVATPAAPATPAPKAVEAAKQAAPEAAPHIEVKAAQPAPPAPVATAAPEHHPAPTAAVTPAAPATAAPAAATPAVQPTDHHAELAAESAKLVKEFDAGHIDQGQAVERFIALDRKLNGGSVSVVGIELTMGLMGTLTTHEEQKARLHAAAASNAQQAKPAEPAASHDKAATATPPATHPASPEAAPPKVELGAPEQALVDNFRTLKTQQGDHIATLLTEIDGLVHKMSAHLDDYEYAGTGRDDLVGKIGTLRQALATLEAPAMDKTALAHLKELVYRHLQYISPYYSQYRNVDVLEQFQGDRNTRTCNVTSLSMALESLGATPGTYDSGRLPIVERVSSYFNNEQTRAAAIGAKAGKGKGLDHADLKVGTSVTGLRMPDFIELVAIAENCTATSTDEEINKARWDVWNQILSFDFLQTLATRFHVPAKVAALKNADGKSVGNDLFKHGYRKTGKGELDTQRMDVEHLVDARNRVEHLEAVGKTKTPEYADAKATYDAMAAKEQDVLSGKGSPIANEDYKKAVLAQVGAQFADGKAIVIGLSGHFTRLQGIDEHGLIIGDPGRWDTGSHRKVLWEEARGMGYFHHFMVMG